MSSEEEIGDALNIKPPQLRLSKKDRHRDRMRGGEYEKSRSSGGGQYSGSSSRGSGSREYMQSFGGGGRSSKEHHRRYEEEPVGRSRKAGYELERRQRYEDPSLYIGHSKSSGGEERRSSSKHGKEEEDFMYREQHHRKSSQNRRDLEEKRMKRIEMEKEEDRMYQEIERKRERERRELEGTSGSASVGSSSRRYLDEKVSKKHKKRISNSRSMSRSPVEEDDLVESYIREGEMSMSKKRDLILPTIEVEDIEESSSELEEGEERSGERRKDHSDSGEERERGEKKSISSISDDGERSSEEGSQSSHGKSRSPDSKNSSISNSPEEDSDESESDESNNDNDKSKKRNGESSGSRDKKRKHESDSSQESPEEIKKDSDIEEIPQKKSKEQPPSPEVQIEEEKDEFDLLPPYYPALQGCRRVEEFQLLNRIEEGTYGVVYRAKDKRKNEVVALKRLKMEKEKDGFPITSLREINTLLKAQHENIVTVREIVVGSNTDKIFLVMDYVEHDLKSLMETLKLKEQYFMINEIKCLMIQLLRAVAHMHDNWILHRDLKTSNLLLSHKGILKVGDFGLAREYGSPLKPYTSIVVTLWYRSPELLLGVKEYSTPIDVWSVGCIFGELLKMEPMFPGKSEANQLNLIFQTLGTPNDRIWPGYSKLPLLQKMTFADYPLNKLKTRFGMLTDYGIDMMNKLLTFNPNKRVTAEEALKHRFFEEAPLPIDPSLFPTWPAKSELGSRALKQMASPKPPSGGRQYKDLKDDEDQVGFFLAGAQGDRRTGPPVGGGFSLKF